MFSGSYAVTIDDKGRMAVPAFFRPALNADAGGKLSLIPTPEGLRIYPTPVFERIAKNDVAKHPDLKQRAAMMVKFVGAARSVELDTQGRVLIPTDFRAQFIGAAVLMGQMDYFVLSTEADAAKRDAQLHDDFVAGLAALDVSA